MVTRWASHHAPRHTQRLASPLFALGILCCVNLLRCAVATARGVYPPSRATSHPVCTHHAAEGGRLQLERELELLAFIHSSGMGNKVDSSKVV
jgi:hypothetical protein